MTSVGLGIDQSFSGFAVAAVAPATSDYFVLESTWSGAKYGSGVTRLKAIRGWLESVFWHLTVTGGFDIAHICMEGYSPGSKFGREYAGELGAVVKLAIADFYDDDLGFPTIVPPTSLKKFVTGKGSAPKDTILKEVFRKWGFDVDSNNAADALGLAKIAFALSSEGEDLLAYEREVLSNLKRNTERWPTTR